MNPTNPIEQLEALRRREQRLFDVKWSSETSVERREAIRRIQHKIWREKARMADLALAEERRLLWPNGLPAHP